MASIARKWAEIKRLELYENEDFFVSQLFERNWTPRSPALTEDQAAIQV